MMVGMVHQEIQLSSKIVAADTIHIQEVGSVHTYQEIVFFIVGIGELPRRVTIAGWSWMMLAMYSRVVWPSRSFYPPTRLWIAIGI